MHQLDNLVIGSAMTILISCMVFMATLVDGGASPLVTDASPALIIVRTPTALPWRELARWEGVGPLRTELFETSGSWRLVTDVPVTLRDNHGTVIEVITDAGRHQFRPGQYSLAMDAATAYTITVEVR